MNRTIVTITIQSLKNHNGRFGGPVAEIANPIQPIPLKKHYSTKTDATNHLPEKTKYIRQWSALSKANTEFQCNKT